MGLKVNKTIQNYCFLFFGNLGGAMRMAVSGSEPQSIYIYIFFFPPCTAICNIRLYRLISFNHLPWPRCFPSFSRIPYPQGRAPHLQFNPQMFVEISQLMQQAAMEQHGAAYILTQDSERSAFWRIIICHQEGQSSFRNQASLFCREMRTNV